MRNPRIKPFMTKAQFKEVIELLKKQKESDHRFADFMEGYLDGRFVPTMSEHAHSAAIKALSAAFNDKDEGCGTFVEWFVYECDFGKNRMSARLGGKDYAITNAGQMYDLLVKWMNSDGKA